jgi:DNA-binding transcriptional LysR family regulator
MELHHIRAFVTLADELNITRAAARLHLSQPNLTRKLKSLEAEIAVVLFQRTNRGLTLTPAGRAFLDEARTVLSASAKAVEMARRCARDETEQLRVGYLMGLPKVTAVMAGFQRMHPQVGLTLFEMTPAEQLRKLESGQIDLGFIGLPYALRDTGLSGHCVARYETVVALPEASALARRKRLRLSDLEDQVLLGINVTEYPHWDQWSKDLARKGFKYQQARTGPTQMSALLDQVAANLGVSLFPEHSLAHEGVVFRHVTPPLITDLYVAWKPANRAPLLHQFLRMVGARTVKHTSNATRPTQ